MDKKPLELYRLMIRSLIASNGAQRIGNESAEHAKVLIEEFVRNAVRTIDIVCHSLSDDVWGSPSVRAALSAALRTHPIRLRIVVQRPPSESAVRYFSSIGATIRRLDRPGLRANFLIVDDRYFRMEPDFSIRRGFAYVNKPEWASELAADFRAIYALAV